MDKKVTLAQLKEVVQEAYDQVKTNTGGKNADYIPYLANVNKDLFGISVCLLNGQTIHVGDTDYRFGNVAVLTTDNILKVYDGTTGALLTDVEAAPVEEAQYISVTALPDGYALLQYDDENYNTIAIQTYGGEGLLWSSAGEAQQYTYASYLTSTARGPLLTACRDSRDGSSLYDVLDMEGNLLFRRLGSCYSIDGLSDDCFIARQGFDYGLMDSTGQWLYRESIFSSPSDDAGGGYLY